MARDTLYLLDPAFPDAKLPGRQFHCRDCMVVEGLLASFPELAARLDVVRVAFARPRPLIVEKFGEAHQNLPALAFGEGGFVNDIDGVLDALATRHGFPERRP